MNFFKRKEKILATPHQGDANSNDQVKYGFNNLTQHQFQLLLKYGKASANIGGFKSKAFIELPYGMVKKDVPALLKDDKVVEAINLIMECQYEKFELGNSSGNEVFGFLIWILSQYEFIKRIESRHLHSDPDPEMLAAGISRLNEFGEMSVIDNLANGKILEYDRIEALPYFKVYQKLKLDKIIREINKKYQKIIEEKTRKK
ncbi:hypothetical protein [Chryseobacterium potabilaquae]|uniref:Uncharacterized protein n=1 Tax=Chryseobacterium potabilaquae TaxID=2675057 RepID=A0A6N4X5R6_9FLAO|nr:hypothetical protein [Chryseobacterium potabilaquae]CAA7195436.1 hypothetical protein CHRY9293_01634 [Chryseobacterium potabilaquae]